MRLSQLYKQVLGITLFVLSHNAAPAQASDLSVAWTKVCSALEISTKCVSLFQYPDQIDTVYGSLTLWKYNPHKEKIKGCVLGVCGWTWKPGFDSYIQKVPKGLTVRYKRYSSCDLLGRFLPNWKEASSRISAACKCLPKLFSLIDSKTATAFLEGGGNIGPGSAEILLKWGEYEQCSQTAVGGIQNNAGGLTTGSGALVSSPTRKIVVAAQVDTARYAALGGAIAPCFVGACCTNCIVAWLQKYLADSQALMGGQLKAMIQPWLSTFTAISTSFDAASSNANSAVTKIPAIRDKAVLALRNVCANASCVEIAASSAIADFQAQLTKTLDVTQQLSVVTQTVGALSSDVQQLVSAISTASKAFDALDDLTYAGILKMVTNGEIKQLSDIPKTFQGITVLPKLFQDVESRVPKLTTALQQIVDKGPVVVTNFESLLSDTWVRSLSLANCQSQLAIQSVFIDIQEAVSSTIPQIELFSTATAQLQEMVGLIAKSSLGSLPQIDAGVASYQRWSKGSFTSICSKITQKTISRFGFKIDVFYPEFWTCQQPYYVPWPNHHIPYLRIRFPANSLFAALTRPSTAKGTTIRFAKSVVSRTCQANTTTSVSLLSTTSSVNTTTTTASRLSTSSQSVTGTSLSSQSSNSAVTTSSFVTSTSSRSSVFSTSTTSIFSSSSTQAGTSSRSTSTARLRPRQTLPATESIETTLPGAMPTVPAGYVTDTRAVNLAQSTGIPDFEFETTGSNGQIATITSTIPPTVTLSVTATETIAAPPVTDIPTITEAPPYAAYTEAAGLPEATAGELQENWEAVTPVAAPVPTDIPNGTDCSSQNRPGQVYLVPFENSLESGIDVCGIIADNPSINESLAAFSTSARRSRRFIGFARRRRKAKTGL